MAGVTSSMSEGHEELVKSNRVFGMEAPSFKTETHDTRGNSLFYGWRGNCGSFKFSRDPLLLGLTQDWRNSGHVSPGRSVPPCPV